MFDSDVRLLEVKLSSILIKTRRLQAIPFHTSSYISSSL
ncbi:hypothetical protein BPJM79_120015 [Bacillus pumilus]